MSRFAATSPELVASVNAGASIDEAARQVGVPVATVRRWLRDGRKDQGGPRGAFAAAVDGARRDRRQAEQAAQDEAMTAEEADVLLTRAARKGSVPALRLWFERRAAAEMNSSGRDAREALAAVFDDR